MRIVRNVHSSTSTTTTKNRRVKPNNKTITSKNCLYRNYESIQSTCEVGQFNACRPTKCEHND